jgi:hypothetical protein
MKNITSSADRALRRGCSDSISHHQHEPYLQAVGYTTHKIDLQDVSNTYKHVHITPNAPRTAQNTLAGAGKVIPPVYNSSNSFCCRLYCQCLAVGAGKLATI